jgi:hypothetical protein
VRFIATGTLGIPVQRGTPKDLGYSGMQIAPFQRSERPSIEFFVFIHRIHTTVLSTSCTLTNDNVASPLNPGIAGIVKSDSTDGFGEVIAHLENVRDLCRTLIQTAYSPGLSPFSVSRTDIRDPR